MWNTSLFALLSLVAAPVLAYWAAPSKQAPPAVRSVQWLDTANEELLHHGLLHRDDVAIRINDAEIARAYSRADCDGLLLVAQLPNTAQGWHNVVPRIDFSRYEVRYVYDGSVYNSVPTLQRLRDWLVGTLPGRSARRELVIGLAEAGRCELTARALRAFDAKLSTFEKETRR